MTGSQGMGRVEDISLLVTKASNRPPNPPLYSSSYADTDSTNGSISIPTAVTTVVTDIGTMTGIGSGIEIGAGAGAGAGAAVSLYGITTITKGLLSSTAPISLPVSPSCITDILLDSQFDSQLLKDDLKVYDGTFIST